MPTHIRVSALSLGWPSIKPVRILRNRIGEDIGRVSDPTLKITYRYADAGNWKFWGAFHVLGNIKIDDLRPHLFDGEFFIPERIGVPSLVPTAKNEDDHLLHTFEEIDAVERASYECTADELIERVRVANEEGWFAGVY
jgi:hypothetical protein